jgi:5'-AMP-activated protein kinase catalytic alpha subunit
MIQGKKYSGLGVDIWSSGVILFAMVCGCLPFEDNDTSKLYKKILSGKFTPVSGISETVKDLLGKILNIDPEKRYTI